MSSELEKIRESVLGTQLFNKCHSEGASEHELKKRTKYLRSIGLETITLENITEICGLKSEFDWGGQPDDIWLYQIFPFMTLKEVVELSKKSTRGQKLVEKYINPMMRKKEIIMVREESKESDNIFTNTSLANFINEINPDSAAEYQDKVIIKIQPPHMKNVIIKHFSEENINYSIRPVWKYFLFETLSTLQKDQKIMLFDVTDYGETDEKDESADPEKEEWIYLNKNVNPTIIEKLVDYAHKKIRFFNDPSYTNVFLVNKFNELIPIFNTGGKDLLDGKYKRTADTSREGPPKHWINIPIKDNEIIKGVMVSFNLKDNRNKFKKMGLLTEENSYIYDGNLVEDDEDEYD